MTKGNKQKAKDVDINILKTLILLRQVRRRISKEIKFYGKGSSKQRKDISQVQCFRCDQYGHYAIKCPNRTKKQASFAKVGKTNIEDDYEKVAFYSALSRQVSNKLNTWVIDSGS